MRLLWVLVWAGQLCAASGVWVGFRYDSSHVLAFFEETGDVPPVMQAKAERDHLPDPVARWGRGGYLLPLPGAGHQLTGPLAIALGGDAVVSGTPERYVEQWGSSHPTVQVGVLLRINPKDLARFRNAHSDYFLVYSGLSPEAAVVVLKETSAETVVLNRFGRWGQLILDSREAGWSVTLWRTQRGALVPTAVRYAYGD